jgi:hypothetical protein
LLEGTENRIELRRRPRLGTPGSPLQSKRV